MLGVVALRELEDRLAGALGQPDYRAYNQLRRPFHLVQQPRCGDSRQIRRGGPIDVERRIRMPLEKRRRHFKVDLTLDRAPYDRSLVLSGGQNEDLARLQNGGDSHRHRLTRHVVFTEEIG